MNAVANMTAAPSVAAGTAEPFMRIQNATKRFFGLTAVDDVSFDVARGEIVSIIGPNGAGKTTLFNLLTGQLRPTSGDIRLEGEVINTLRPDQRARKGLGRTFQITKPLVALTAVENVMVGAFLHTHRQREARERAHAVLEQVGLAGRDEVKAGELTPAERRRLEVGRAIALQPKVVLLDEVMAGLNQSEVEGLIEVVRGLHRSGLTLMIIEHNLKVVRAFSERVIVLDRGAKIAEGDADTILNMPNVVKAYLGERRR